ncbi:hypothetical protein [Halovivax gelatinilyticus]|uniref:hypothetical protein n=1 Tax=Halovivax gelatinilyticus TaxID=2961597 RepID=UPI0020CA9B3D|nr:hypothetical protein [Halovivax gelatinilyticus]
MGLREDATNAIRRTILPQIHYLLHGTFDGYAVSHTTEDEYVATVHCSESEIESMLSAVGFSRNPIASLKVRFDGNTSEGSWVWRDHLLSDDQLHVVLHTLDGRDDRVDVYAHWERSWIRHPYAHYVARGYDADRGVELTQELFDRWAGQTLSNGTTVKLERDNSLARQASEYVSLSYYRVTEWVIAVRDRIPLVDGERSFTEDRSDERDTVSPRITDDI